MSLTEHMKAKVTAERIGVTAGCLAKWRMTGEGPAYIRVGRRIAYDPRDVQVWLDARRVQSTSQELAA